VCSYILIFQFLYGFSAPIHENFPHNLYFWLAIGTLAWMESEPAHCDSENQPSLEKLMSQLQRFMPNTDH